MKVLALVCFSGALTAIAVASEADRDRNAEAFFENRVRPLLARHCQECHGPEPFSKGALAVPPWCRVTPTRAC